MVSQDSVLSPTPFIQSTHNTIGGQISLLLQSHAYNFTYAQRAHSFENALQDALMMIGEGTENILVGGIDEVTNTSVDVISKLPCGHESPTSTSQIGEGSAFFVLSANKQPHTYAQIVAFETKYGSAETEALADWIRNCLIQANLKIADVDGLLLGESGDVQDDQLYGQIKHRLFPHTPSFAFKSLSGEYFTAVSFGLNLAANMIKHQQFYSLGSMPSGSQGINSLLIYNHYKNKYHSLILLQKC
ncbi:MAG: hypothetical protein HC819_06390 [Cyclobacteriaceae bacterium]|nr:hypothetical protein [Cyclobacteriaceae bacterium]